MVEAIFLRKKPFIQPGCVGTFCAAKKGVSVALSTMKGRSRDWLLPSMVLEKGVMCGTHFRLDACIHVHGGKKTPQGQTFL